MKTPFLYSLIIAAALSCNSKTKYETIIRNGTIYDGNGGKPFTADIAINAVIGDLKNATATNKVDVFVNGTAVLKNGEHTNAKPGRFVKGPGYKDK